MSSTDIRADVLLALQIAMLGMITPNIRGVTCKWDSSTITIKYIYDDNFTEDDSELCEEIVTEVMSHFPKHHVTSQIVTIRAPLPFKKEFLTAWVYMRREEKPGLESTS